VKEFVRRSKAFGMIAGRFQQPRQALADGSVVIHNENGRMEFFLHARP